ncbi:MAG TPA: ABC-F family ATP-binding cassette domain-containing protein [Bacillota bacterium]|jgi:ATP-binding cassette subfamily F protein 3
MSILTVKDVSKYFGAQRVLDHISFAIGRGERVGLVGRNGVGKTTLLRLIMGQEEADSGEIAIAHGCRLGYLEQEATFDPERSLSEEVGRVFDPLRRKEDELRAVEAEMSRPDVVADPERLEKVMARYTRLTHEFEAAGGYDYAAEVKVTLGGLGFAPEEGGLPMGALSGGQKTRAFLARLLLGRPDLLLLDEPTNHLDIQAAEWLEEYLSHFPGGILIVSHDRYFLDSVAQKIIELDEGGAEQYTGNFSSYVAQRDERRRRQETEYRRQQEEVAEMKFFIAKWKAGTRSTLAKSVEKRLAKVEPIGRPRSTVTMKLHFNVAETGGREVLKLRGLAKGYPGRELFRGVDATVVRGDRVALIGKNGTGKTTLLKIAMGMIEPTAGQAVWGGGVEVGYFSQDLDDLDDAKTVLDEIMGCGDFLPGQARSYLGRFLFRGEEVHKLVGTLSGGERSRLYLAKLVLGRANALVLDEPTNHLDLESKEVLEEALKDYPGTIVVVSHDRYFIDRLATRVFDIDGGRIAQYRGNYTTYRMEKAKQMAAQASGAGAALAPRTAPRHEEFDRPRPGRGGGRREREGKDLELTILALEKEKAALDKTMGDPGFYRRDGHEVRETMRRYEQLMLELDQAYKRWEELIQR